MIPEYLIKAFISTTFHVYNPAIDIRINSSNDKLDELLKKYNADSWSYITAYNPYSKQLSDEENLNLHQQLRKLLSGYYIFEGEGIGEDKTWKPEKSFLILNITKEKAQEIGNRFQQYAIVFGKINSPAELILFV